jgi:hypothetical protein
VLDMGRLRPNRTRPRCSEFPAEKAPDRPVGVAAAADAMPVKASTSSTPSGPGTSNARSPRNAAASSLTPLNPLTPLNRFLDGAK